MPIHFIHLLIVIFLCPKLCMCDTSLQCKISPSTCSSVNGDHQKCLTLERFTDTIAKGGLKAIADVQLFLLPGNHTLSTNFTIAGLDSLSMNATSDSNKTSITCNGSILFTLSNISEVTFSGVDFFGCQNIICNKLGHLVLQNCNFFIPNNDISQLKFHETEALIEKSTFRPVSMDLYPTSESSISLFYSYFSNLTIEGSVCTMLQSSALVGESESNITISNSLFFNNKPHDHPMALIQLSNGNLFIENSNISCNMGKMIVYARECTINVSNSYLNGNVGIKCILCLVKSLVYLRNVSLKENLGNSSVIVYLLKTQTTIKGITFLDNYGSFLIMNSNASFSALDIVFANCSQLYDPNINDNILQAQGTLTVVDSTVSILVNAVFIENHSKKSGGAVYFSHSNIIVYNRLHVASNTAERSGGGALLHLSTFMCLGNCTFEANKANVSGGGIHAISSVILLTNDASSRQYAPEWRLDFVGNEAGYGAGLYLEVNSKLIAVIDGINSFSINFANNNVVHGGGAIFVHDETYSTVCDSTTSFVHSIETECFFQIKYGDIEARESEKQPSIYFSQNTAEFGPVLYGGLLDRCSISTLVETNYEAEHNNYTKGLNYFILESGSNVDILNEIASDGMRVCFCPQNISISNCAGDIVVRAHKGEMFNIPVVVIDQVNNTVNATVRASLLEENIMGEGQQLQRTFGQCTLLSFNISSPHESVNLTLYPDQGPCQKKGLSRFTVKVEFEECACAIGFKRSPREDVCECDLDPALKIYVTVEKFNSLKRKNNFWITYNSYTGSNNMGSKYEYFVHPNCPYDYCKPPESSLFNLSDPDAQCNFNRSGLLCGQCTKNYSLSAFSSRCFICHKDLSRWPVLSVIVGAIAGILLVIILLLFNLTVALGTFNGIIFYANIVVTNETIFLSLNKTKFFTAFVYLLNSKLGIDRCLWEGLDAYSRAWFSYLFPLYIIFLIIVIIVVSKSSTRCASMIGKRNPVATLATLVFLSYTYLIRISLKILSFGILNYPNGMRKVVWLPDASVKYFHGIHIPLLLSALCVLTIGTAYAFLIFSWQWLHKAPDMAIFRWTRYTKLNLFIDPYHAPYRPKYRFWTGILLLARVALNIVLVVNKSGNPKYNLLATGILTAFLTVLKANLGDKLYKSTVTDFMESICYLNLLMLTLFSFYFLHNNQKKDIAVSLSISVIFVMFMCALVYHVHCALKSIERYKKLCESIGRIVRDNRISRNYDKRSIVDQKTFCGCTKTEVALSEINHGENDCTLESINITQSDDNFCRITNNSNDLREPLL